MHFCDFYAFFWCFNFGGGAVDSSRDPLPRFGAVRAGKYRRGPPPRLLPVSALSGAYAGHYPGTWGLRPDGGNHLVDIPHRLDVEDIFAEFLPCHRTTARRVASFPAATSSLADIAFSIRAFYFSVYGMLIITQGDLYFCTFHGRLSMKRDANACYADFHVLGNSIWREEDALCVQCRM